MYHKGHPLEISIKRIKTRSCGCICGIWQYKLLCEHNQQRLYKRRELLILSRFGVNILGKYSQEVTDSPGTQWFNLKTMAICILVGVSTRVCMCNLDVAYFYISLQSFETPPCYVYCLWHHSDKIPFLKMNVVPKGTPVGPVYLAQCFTFLKIM